MKFVRNDREVSFITALERLVGETNECLIIVTPFFNQFGFQKVIDSMPRKAIEILILISNDPRNLAGNGCDLDALILFINDLRTKGHTVRLKSLPKLHAKLFISDCSKLLLGSANLTSGGIALNVEFGVTIENQDHVGIARDWIIEDLWELAGSEIKDSVLAYVASQNRKVSLELEEKLNGLKNKPAIFPLRSQTRSRKDDFLEGRVYVKQLGSSDEQLEDNLIQLSKDWKLNGIGFADNSSGVKGLVPGDLMILYGVGYKKFFDILTITDSVSHHPQIQARYPWRCNVHETFKSKLRSISSGFGFEDLGVELAERMRGSIQRGRTIISIDSDEVRPLLTLAIKTRGLADFQIVAPLPERYFSFLLKMPTSAWRSGTPGEKSGKTQWEHFAEWFKEAEGKVIPILLNPSHSDFKEKLGYTVMAYLTTFSEPDTKGKCRYPELRDPWAHVNDDRAEVFWHVLAATSIGELTFSDIGDKSYRRGPTKINSKKIQELVSIDLRL